MRNVVLALVLAAFVGVTFLSAFATTTLAEESCDPYPIGRCGAYQRETVKWCYYTVNGRLVEATEPHVIAAGPATPGVVSLEGGVAGSVYFRKAPTEAVVANPWEAPLPVGSAYLETNGWNGLQTKESRCSDFIWFAECEPPQWMWFTFITRPADKLVA